MSETPPAPALGAQQAVELDEIRERTFQRAKMYLLANGLSDPSQLPAEYTDPARLLQGISDQAARLAAAEELWRLGAHTAACQAGLGYGGCEPTCSRLRALIAPLEHPNV